MLTQDDLKQIASLGISEEKVNEQLGRFEHGFPFLKLEAACDAGKGVTKTDAALRERAQKAWAAYKEEGHTIVKFVPASGAASRMFKNMFAFLDAPYDVPTTDFEKEYFDNIKKFAFHKALCDKCKENDGMGLCKLIEAGKYKEVVANMLLPKGLNYGALPKGLLQFHNYEDGPRTPMEEHLVEAALYASSKGEANIHFTVSHEHLELFKALVAEKLPYYEKKFGVKYNVSFSEQKASTNTIAANADNTPFREADGTLLFRPGGHGALIENLNEIDADVVFIKNIDNVVPDREKDVTVEYKNVIAGMLVELQQKAFAYLRLLDSGKYTHADLEEIIRFLQNDLCCRKPDIKNLEDADLVVYLRSKLNRPMRVVGVVKNEGEPGGGPFYAYNADGTVSTQILESAQINKNDPESVAMYKNGAYFSPTDLACAIKDYKGQPFDLTKRVDPECGFMTEKSKGGKVLKALELPGLWNGSMSDWCTVFVDVPSATFNPVKTVNDLLRPAHM